MLAKLIAVLLQAKAGAISGVFLLGATGALISVSASNGVTTVTITEASPSPKTSVSAPVSVAAPASPKLAADPTACAAEAQAIAFQVKRVDSAYAGFRADLEKLRKDHSKDAVKASDKTLKEIRKSAVKAIHATRACKHDDDEDKDEDADKADTTSASDEDKDENKDEDANDQNDDHKTTSGLAFSGTASAIADAALTAMQAAFDSAKNAPATPRKPEEVKRPESPKRPEAAQPGRPSEAQHRD